jgi:hypothetical protein
VFCAECFERDLTDAGLCLECWEFAEGMLALAWWMSAVVREDVAA